MLCTGTVNCSDPATSLTAADFPASISTTSTTPTLIYNSDPAITAGSGEGPVDIGQVTTAEVTAGVLPAAWWVDVPLGTPGGLYGTTVTVNIGSGPTFT
jgi:hypothetical protein